VEGRTVVVWSDAVAAPTAVRYDWGNTPRGNLCNIAGLPAPPFRTTHNGEP
jgi:sialate O-acetylesterase